MSLKDSIYFVMKSLKISIKNALFLARMFLNIFKKTHPWPRFLLERFFFSKVLKKSRRSLNIILITSTNFDPLQYPSIPRSLDHSKYLKKYDFRSGYPFILSLNSTALFKKTFYKIFLKYLFGSFFFTFSYLYWFLWRDIVTFAHYLRLKNIFFAIYFIFETYLSLMVWGVWRNWIDIKLE